MDYDIFEDDSILVCPYCKQPQDTHESDDVDADMANTECEYCGKCFGMPLQLQGRIHHTRMMTIAVMKKMNLILRIIHETASR